MRSLLTSLAACATVALLAFACSPEIPDGKLLCAADAECPRGFGCDLASQRCRRDFDGGTQNPNDAGDAGDASPDASCGAGYQASGGECVDIDECQTLAIVCGDREVCLNTPGSYQCICAPEFTRVGLQCKVSCDPNANADDGVRTVNVSVFRLPVADPAEPQRIAGFDFDGLDNSAVSLGGSGTSIAGCGAPDYVDGVDNAYARAAPTLFDGGQGIDLSSAMQDEVTQGRLAMSFAISRMGPDSAFFDCVSVDFVVDGVHNQGVGVRVGDTIEVDFPNPVAVDFEVLIASSKYALVHRLRDARARLVLGQEPTALAAGSLLGGYLFYTDPAINNYVEFKTAIANWLGALGAEEVVSVVQGLFSGVRDLRMSPSGVLEHCTGDNEAMTNKNAISVGWVVE